MGGRSNSSRRTKQKQRDGKKKSRLLQCFSLFFGPPPVVDEEPLMSVDQFRELHRRRHKGKAIQVLRPVHYLHPRAVLLVVLYRSLMSDPHVRNRIPRRLRTCLEFHRTMILYDGYPATVVDDEGDVFQPAQEEPEEAELGQASSGAGAEEAECSSAEVDRRHARASCTGTATTAASRVSGSLDEIDHHSDIDHAPAEPEPVAVPQRVAVPQLVAEQAPPKRAPVPPQQQAAQAVPIEAFYHEPEAALEEDEGYQGGFASAQAGRDNAERQGEAAAAAEVPVQAEAQGGFASPREGPDADDGDDTSSCDEAAYTAMLGSSPVRAVQRQEVKRSASPARHGYSQPVIKINARAAGGQQPAPMEVHLPGKGEGEARRRFVYDGLRWTSLAEAKAARRNAPSPLKPTTTTTAPPAAPAASFRSAAAAEKPAAAHKGKEDLSAILNKIGADAGLRTAEESQARLVALEAMIGGAEAELARMATRPARKVSSLIKTFHELEESASANSSPRIPAPRKVPPLNLNLGARPATQQDFAPTGSANPSAYDAPNPIKPPARQEGARSAAGAEPVARAAAAHAEHKAPYQEAPPRAQAASGAGAAPQGFAAAARHFFNPEHVANPLFAEGSYADQEAADERLLWSSPDFTAEFNGQPNPELAARHAAAAARHAAAAARHAAAAAQFAGLRAGAQKHASPVVEPSQPPHHAAPPCDDQPASQPVTPKETPRGLRFAVKQLKQGEQVVERSMTSTVNNLLFEP